jgi:hypothetical protein
MRKAAKAIFVLGLGVVATLGGAAALAQTNGYAKIGAQFQIIGKDALDPPPGQKKDRVALFLSGDGAKQIYQAMPARAIKSPCEEGMKLKTSGGMECWENHGDYQCRVAILLKSGQTSLIGAC